jgi:hypothetical protein
MEGLHEYRENQRTTCLECARLFRKYGETDAQVQDVHEFMPIVNDHNTSEKKRKRSVSRSKSPKKTRGGKLKNPNSRRTQKK